MFAILAAIVWAIGGYLDWTSSADKHWLGLLFTGLVFIAIHLVYPWSPWIGRRRVPPSA